MVPAAALAPDIIHYLEESTRAPLCRRDAERAMWNWTLEPSAVSCPSCRALLEATPKSIPGRKARLSRN
jgi:hypothetical protein